MENKQRLHNTSESLKLNTNNLLQGINATNVKKLLPNGDLNKILMSNSWDKVIWSQCGN